MEQPNGASRRRAAAAAALAWALLAAVWAVFGPGPAAVPDSVSGILRSCLLLPLVEELVFRGAALRLLQPLGGGVAVVVQAVLFAALHGTFAAKAYALGMGLIFGWAAQRTRSIWPGVLLHILNNGLALALSLAERGMG